MDERDLSIPNKNCLHKCDQAPFPIFWVGPGDEASSDHEQFICVDRKNAISLISVVGLPTKLNLHETAVSFNPVHAAVMRPGVD